MSRPKKETSVIDTKNEIPFETIAKAVTQIGDSLAKIEKTRVTRKLIIALIHDDTRLTKGVIETVLDSYENLASKYLKKR